MRCCVSLTVGLMTSLAASGQTPKKEELPKERKALLAAGTGVSVQEAAIARGLAWLARNQLKDGTWQFDGSRKDPIVAATGMALLPFLVAGESPGKGLKYADTVRRGIDWLAQQVGDNGMFGKTTNAYAHALGTMALCEVYRLDRDEKVRAKAELAVKRIVEAQHRRGSWSYDFAPTVSGDTSILGWQIQALSSAKLAGIKFDHEKVFKAADDFLLSVSSDQEALYGYRDQTPTQSLTPVGLLSRLSMGKLDARQPSFARGVEFIMKVPPRKDFYDMYYYFYATRVLHQYDGPDWQKTWKPKMRDLLIDLQRKGSDDVRGSWDKDLGHIGSSCGRLGTTAMAILTLQEETRPVLTTPLPKDFPMLKLDR